MNTLYLRSAYLIFAFAIAAKPAMVEAQFNKQAIKPLMDTIAPPFMGGRGYVDSGLYRAAGFIESFFKQHGVKPAPGAKQYRQPFTHSINAFNGMAKLTLNGTDLLAGREFIVHPGSRGIKGVGQLEPLDSIRWIDAANRLVIEKADKLPGA